MDFLNLSLLKTLIFIGISLTIILLFILKGYREFQKTKSLEKTQSPIDIYINTTLLIGNEDGKEAFYLIPNVIINNQQTNSPIYLKLNDNSLKISRVTIDGDQVHLLDEATSISYEGTPNDDTPNSINYIPHSSKIKLNYFAKLDKLGIYNVTFTADATDIKEYLLFNKNSGELTKLFSSKYIYVKTSL